MELRPECPVDSFLSRSLLHFGECATGGEHERWHFVSKKEIRMLIVTARTAPVTRSIRQAIVPRLRNAETSPLIYRRSTLNVISVCCNARVYANKFIIHLHKVVRMSRITHTSIFTENHMEPRLLFFSRSPFVSLYLPFPRVFNILNRFAASLLIISRYRAAVLCIINKRQNHRDGNNDCAKISRRGKYQNR